MARKTLRHNRGFSLKDKAEAIERVISGQAQKYSAIQAGCSEYAMSNWMRQYFGPRPSNREIITKKSKL